MNANEAIEKIKVALGFTPEVTVELAKKKDTEETPEVVEEEVVEVVEEVPVEKTESELAEEAATAERIRQADEKLRKDREELEEEIKHMGIKMSEQTAEIIKVKSAVSELLEVVKFLSLQPTAEPTEKNNGIRTFLSDQRKDSLAKFQDGFKTINEKIKN